MDLRGIKSALKQRRRQFFPDPDLRRIFISRDYRNTVFIASQLHHRGFCAKLPVLYDNIAFHKTQLFTPQVSSVW